MLSDKNLDLVKLAIKVISGASVSKIVNDIITNNTISESKSDAVKIWIGSGMIGSMIVEHNSKRVDDKVDRIVLAINEAKKEQAFK